MYYIQYYHKAVNSDKLIEACGDRSVVILDGRCNIETMNYDAIHFNGLRRPHYDGYAILKGETFTRSTQLTDIMKLRQ